MNARLDTESDYKAAVARVEFFLKKGFSNLSKEETQELEMTSKIASSYEKSHYPIPSPATLAEMIELKMYEMRLTQKKLSEILKVAPEKLSMILNGKRNPDVSFLKAAHEQLGIDATFLLTHA